MSNFRIDTSEVEKVINELSTKGLDRIQKVSLRSGAKRLYDDTRRNFLSSLPAARGNNINSSRRYNDKLIDAVRMGVYYDSGTHEYYFKVHILGSRAKNSGTFRARFFEGGTVERINKRTGGSYGRIRPLNFFKSAVDTDRSIVISEVRNTFYNELNKIVK